MTNRTSFQSGGEKIAAWITLPKGNGPHPTILLVHGGGATHDMILEQYEKWFSEAGLAVVAFDFRGLGKSEGQPRQLMSVHNYLEDIDSALNFIKTQPELDDKRIGLWGTSFGASHVVVTAAHHPEIKAAVIQCPVLSGRSLAFTSGFKNIVRLTGPILSDVIRSLFKLPRKYVPIVGKPGELAFVNQPGAYEGWYSVAPKESSFENRTPASSGIGLVFYNAIDYAKDIQCPLFVCVSDKENLIDPNMGVIAAKKAPHGEFKHYAADHFTVYHQPLVEQIVKDQIAFFSKHLKST